MSKLWIFLGMAAVTYSTRVTMIALLGKELPSLVQRWLRYVPAAVLAALIAPAALMPQGQFAWGPHVPAVLVGAVVAWRTRNVLLTIVVGMAIFYALRALGW
jgi:branched-subunit amino acid transport protein